MVVPEIQGLFLSGGRSQRMGTDKALLKYGSRSELERWKAIFDELNLAFYWSVRPGQYPKGQFSDILRLEDTFAAGGPLAALMGAFQHRSDRAWLVLACDWPLLGRPELHQLLMARNPAEEVTVFEVQGTLEPLCTIYEPKFLTSAWLAFQNGETSLYRLLKSSAQAGIVPPNAENFLNANDPETQVKIRSLQNPLHQNDH